MIGKGKKTVFIDDNLMMRNIIKRKLEGYGFIVDLGESATTLFELLENNNYDIIFLDDMMPNISGTEAMKELKKRAFPVPIVVITSNASPADRDRYLAEGFDEYISKDDINMLETVINKLLTKNN